MRLCLTFQLKESFISVEYRRVVLSYIKNAISTCNNGKYYEYFFKDTKQKNYCFSVILPKAKFGKDRIGLDKNEIKIIISTDNDEKMGFILYSAFIKQKYKSYPLSDGNSMMLNSIIEEKQEEIINSKAIFKTTLGSSLCVRDHNREENKDIYYIYSDKGFRDKLKVVLSNQLLNAGFIKEEIDKVNVNPIQCKKVVVKHYRRYIDTTIGLIEVQANKDILQHFYEVGIGSRKSMGFGMLDLVTQDLV